MLSNSSCRPFNVARSGQGNGRPDKPAALVNHFISPWQNSPHTQNKKFAYGPIIAAAGGMLSLFIIRSDPEKMPAGQA